MVLAYEGRELVGRSLDQDGSAAASHVSGGRRNVARVTYRIAASVVAALLLGVVGLWSLSERPAAQPAPAPPASAVPVSVTKAERQDVQVWLSGIGTVQALNTVTVRARVDGTLMQVPVAEGQVVKQGTVLAVIDPRPYQAAFDAASAKKAQNEAALANAKLDLERYTSLAKQSFASHQQVDTQQMQVNQLTAGLKGDEARSRRRSSTSATATSPRRSTGGSDCVSSIPATWCTRPT